MPNTYDVYLGGARTTNPDTRAFPSAPYNPLALIKAANHKTPVEYALSRVLDTGATAPVTVNGSVGDPALRNFIDFQALSTPVVQGDILRVVALPNGCIFEGFYWAVENALPGFSFSVAFSRIGNSGYTAGQTVIPNGTIGTVLLNAQSGATVASGFVDAGGHPMVADTAIALQSILIGGSILPPSTLNPGYDLPPPGDALCVRLDALPVTGTGAVNFGALRLTISPLVKHLKAGQW